MKYYKYTKENKPNLLKRKSTYLWNFGCSNKVRAQFHQVIIAVLTAEGCELLIYVTMLQLR